MTDDHAGRVAKLLELVDADVPLAEAAARRSVRPSPRQKRFSLDQFLRDHPNFGVT